MKLDNIDYNDNIWRIHVTKYILISLSALTLALVSGLGPVEAKTGEADQHSAHVHGIAELNVAVERTELYMEFISPAANIVGFEHYPRTEEQKAAVQKAMDTFKNWEKLFVLPSRADCTLSDLDVDTNIGGGAHTSDAGDEHGHAAASEVHDEEVHHGGSENEHAGEGARHSEFKAVYHFLCGKPDKLTHADVMLPSVFPGIEHIETQLLTQTKKTALELTKKSNRIDF